MGIAINVGALIGVVVWGASYDATATGLEAEKPLIYVIFMYLGAAFISFTAGWSDGWRFHLASDGGLDTRQKYLAAYHDKGLQPPPTPMWLNSLFGLIVGGALGFGPGYILSICMPEWSGLAGSMIAVGGLSGAAYGVLFMIRMEIIPQAIAEIADDSAATATANPAATAGPTATLLVVYSPSYDRCLGGGMGEVFTILRDDSAEWLRVKNAVGQEGWIPRCDFRMIWTLLFGVFSRVILAVF